MTVTIKDVLKLPSMQGATLLTKSSGLGQAVSTVSVLEYSDPTPIQRNLNENIKYIGNELVLTAFASICNDVDAQCRDIQQFSDAGDTGMILFYVGVLMPKVDSKLIKLANELDYVLITMPPNDMSRTYSSVIAEVMQAIFLDKMGKPVLAVDMLEKISQLPDRQRSLDKVMLILSSELHASIALFDRDYHLLESSSWPISRHNDWDSYVLARRNKSVIMHDHRSVYWDAINGSHRSDQFWLLILINQQDLDLDTYTHSQMIEALRISLNLWGHDTQNQQRPTLLSAIMTNNPVQINAISHAHHLDLKQLHHMWLILNFRGIHTDRYRLLLDELSRQYSSLTLCEEYDHILFIIPKEDPDPLIWQRWGDALAAKCRQLHLAIPVRCQNVTTAALVRQAVYLARVTLDDATTIFPRRVVLTLGDLQLVQTCRVRVASGDQTMSSYLSDWLSLFPVREQTELLETLTTYLLDADQNLQQTAALLFVHPNTVKYRLAKLHTQFGYRVGQMPESWALFEFCGTLRLVRHVQH